MKIAEANRNDKCAPEVLEFLYRWLLWRIAKEDKQIMAHVSKRADR
jgi:hemerythrin